MKPKINTSEVEVARVKLEDLRTMILTDSLSFEKAAMEFSTDENSSNMGGKVMDFNTGGMMHEINNMDPSLFFAIDPLKVGEISEPIRLEGQDGTAYYVIIKLDKRKDAHRANLKDDYAIFQQQAEAIKKNDALEKWMGMQIARTYTQLDPQYRNCPFTYHWVK
jgi:peptidyl-prolyl cis-trans isomerase SurA